MKTMYDYINFKEDVLGMEKATEQLSGRLLNRVK
jgi:hypothetical protein